MAIKIRVYIEGKLLAEGEVPGPLVAMRPAAGPTPKSEQRTGADESDNPFDGPILDPSALTDPMPWDGESRPTRRQQRWGRSRHGWQRRPR